MRKFMSSLPYLSMWLAFNNDLSLLHNLSTTNCDSMREQNVFNYVRVSYWFEVSLLEGDGQNLFRWEAIHHVHHRAPCVPYSNSAIRGLHYVYQLLLMFMAFAFFCRIRFSGFGSRVQDCGAHKEVTIVRLNRASVIKQFIWPGQTVTQEENFPRIHQWNVNRSCNIPCGRYWNNDDKREKKPKLQNATRKNV